MRAYFCLEALCVFHVERLQTEDATKNLFFGISEVQQVGSEGANIFTPFQHLSKTYSRIFLKSFMAARMPPSFLWKIF